MVTSVLQIAQVATLDQIAAVRLLLREYQALLGVDLTFQGFEAEVRDLPGEYAPPNGRLVLATCAEVPVGCVALRPAAGTRCEIKRLFVRPGARGLGAGKSLVSFILAEACAIGYSEVVLDTLPGMVEAQQLYEKFGFCDIAAYCSNPIAGTRYLAKSILPA